jgi:hypothetical protein
MDNISHKFFGKPYSPSNASDMMKSEIFKEFKK